MTAITARTPRFSAFSLVASLLLVSCFSAPARAGDEPFTSPSNFGVTGLLETPTARVMKENRYRLGATQVHPYRYYFGTVGLFDRLEVNGRFTESARRSRLRPEAVQKTKLWTSSSRSSRKESTSRHSLSSSPTRPGRGFTPPSRSSLSKQIFPFDFSFGFGNGRLGKQPLPEQEEGFKIEMFSNPGGWAQRRAALRRNPVRRAADGSPCSRSTARSATSARPDPAQPKYFQTAVPSPFNFGARAQTAPMGWKSTRAGSGGNEIGVSASVAFDIGRPLVPIYDPPYLETVEASRAPLPTGSPSPSRDVGFSDIGVSSDDFTLRIDAENDRYFFAPRAVEVLLDAIAPFVPPAMEYVRVQLKENGIPVAEAAITASALSGAGSGFIPPTGSDATAFRSANFDAPIRATTHRRWFDYGLEPSFETFLNDPSGFFKYRVGSGRFAQRVPVAGRDRAPRRRRDTR